MKHLHFSCVVLAAMCAVTPFAYAQESTSTASTTPEEGLFSTLRDNVQDIRENVQDRVERRAALEARTQERITNLAANISNRFDGIIARLQNITNRLEKRIEKEATEGNEVESARQSLAAAQGALDSAKGHMDDIDEAVSAALGSTDPRTEWKTVRAKFLEARDDIKIAHSELRNTIINVKGAPAAIEAVASSTPPETN
jgi:dGTP triphosphohydrolase